PAQSHRRAVDTCGTHDAADQDECHEDKPGVRPRRRPRLNVASATPHSLWPLRCAGTAVAMRGDSRTAWRAVSPLGTDLRGTRASARPGAPSRAGARRRLFHAQPAAKRIVRAMLESWRALRMSETSRNSPAQMPRGRSVRPSICRSFFPTSRAGQVGLKAYVGPSRGEQALSAAYALSWMNHLIRPNQHDLRDGETERRCDLAVPSLQAGRECIEGGPASVA